MQKRGKPCIAYLATYPPRECGIATFTRDLVSAIDKRFSSVISSSVVAMNHNGVNIYNYPKKVIFEIRDTEEEDYIRVAREINSRDEIKAVNIQHEFGIFGEDYGKNLFYFLDEVRKPVIVTFHSVIQNPNDELRETVLRIYERVSDIVVMTQKAIEILEKDYGIKDKLHLVPHGIPNVSFESQDKEKRELGYSSKFILSSFGMIGPGKGYEYVIDSLPEVVKTHPNLIYLIIGETHPVIRKNEGESYRNFLTDKIKRLGLEKNVKFYNKYLSLSEIIKYLKATDIYISPCKDPNQITSGTLSYAMGMGRAVISTPFLHAKDVITDDKGLLVEFNNAASFTNAIEILINDNQKRREMEKKAYYFTRPMTWSNIAFEYTKIFKKYLSLDEADLYAMPSINLEHLFRLTDDFGITQFAVQSSPDKESGYTLDDNARAMILSTMLYKRSREFKHLSLIRKYLDYISFVQSNKGKLYNFVDKDKKVDYSSWSEDAHGRAVWALGYLSSAKYIPKDLRNDAEVILKKSIPVVEKMNSPRALAFGILGMSYHNSSREQLLKNKIAKLADKLLEKYKTVSKTDWRWFEPYLTYSNSKLPESLLHAFIETKKEEYKKIGLESLDFLIENTFKDGMFAPIGHNGWYSKGKERAMFDQQPVDVAYIVQTLILAHKITSDEKYRKLALNAFQWFLGHNMLQQAVYNESTGGCHDGVGENALNLNQGAESTISYLMARLSMDSLRRK